MSFGFSVGDFLAAGQVIAQITGSLREAAGSKSEYQELLRELESLSRALRHVERLDAHGNSSATIDSIKCAALLCRHPLEQFLGKVQKYEQSLGLWATGGFKSTARKVEWAFRKKEDVRKLRDYLSLHVDSINMLLMSLGLEMLEVAKQQSVDDHLNLRELLQDSCKLTIAVRSDVRDQACIVQENNSMLTKLFGMVRGDIAAPLKMLASTVAKVCVSTQQICNVVLEIRAFLPCLETRFTNFQAPVKVEDALGRIFPVPSEYSFADLEAIIRRRFRKGPGCLQVMNGHFELFCSKFRRRVIPSSDALRLVPGMNVTMAVILEDLPPIEGEVCPMPRCASQKTKAVLGGGRTCGDCGVWFDSQMSRKRKKPAPRVEDESEELAGDDDQTAALSRKRRRRQPREHSADLEEHVDAFRNVKISELEVLPGNGIWRCRNCYAHLALFEDVISRYGGGRLGNPRGFLLDKTVNVTYGESKERFMIDGRCIVRDIFCRKCKEYIGWKYDRADEVTEKYKEGKYIFKTRLLI